MRFSLLILTFLLISSVVPGPELRTLVAQTRDGIQIQDVDVGFAGKYRVGHWTPVWVTLSSEQSTRCEIDVLVPDADGAAVSFSVGETIECQLTANQATRVLRYAKFGRSRSGLKIRVRDNDTVLVERHFLGDDTPTAISSTHGLIVTIGPSIGLSDVVRRIGGDLERAGVAELQETTDLPESWYGYEGVDAVAIIAAEVDPFSRFTANQVSALDKWVHLGGRLILSCGRHGDELLADGKPLASLTPGKFIRTQRLASTTNLERFTEASQRIPAAHDLVVSILELPAKAELTEKVGVSTTASLISRVPVGFGDVVWVGFDLDSRSLADWSGRGNLLVQILTGSRGGRTLSNRSEELGRINHLGYSDMAGQLRAALDQFPGVSLIRFSWVAGFVVAYMLLIGPGDYFLLRKLRIPMYWTWLTFPTFVVLFVGGALWLNLANKGEHRKMNQLDVVDFDVVSGLTRGTTWSHLYSPRTERVAVQFEPRSQNSEQSLNVRAAWQGLPGNGLGGLDATSESSPFSTPYSISADGPGRTDTQITDLPMHGGSSRSLIARWWSESPRERLDNLEADESGLLRGEIGNPFPQTLSGGLVFFDNWVYRIDRPFRSGEKLSLSRLRPLNLHWRLTQRRVVKNADLSTPWDESSTDLPRITEMMMFYQAAGGESYTRLTHRYQPYLDFSTRIRSDWAVLVGSHDRAACEVLIDGKPIDPNDRQNWIVYRALFPVTRSQSRYPE